MNYLKVYCKLVRKFEERNLTRNEGNKLFEYCEDHHIWMRSIYGQEKDGNIRTIIVSAREHFILHAVLEKALIKRYGLHHWKTKKATNAILLMSGNGKYYNSYLYENAKLRRIKQQCKPIRIYFEDGRVLDWYDGKEEYCRQNPQYNAPNMRFLLSRRKHRHKDMLKIEEIDRDNPPPITPLENYNPINRGAIPIRIYFEDGRVIDCLKGMSWFCKKNPKYIPQLLGSLLRGKYSRHKDIIKVEYIREKDKVKNKNRNKITNKTTIDLFLPVRIFFTDGRFVDCREGISYFCKENSYYNSNKMLCILRKERTIHRDVIKVIKLGNKIEVHPTRVNPKKKELIKVDLSKIDYTTGDY